MRIRRRSIAGTLYSSSSSDKAAASTCTDRDEEEQKEEDEEEEGRGRKEFLLPLAAAVAEVGGGGDGIAGIRRRRAHNWRNALSQRDAPDKAVQAVWQKHGLNVLCTPSKYICCPPKCPPSYKCVHEDYTSRDSGYSPAQSSLVSTPSNIMRGY